MNSLSIKTVKIFVVLIALVLSHNAVAQDLTASEIVYNSYNLPAGEDQTSNLKMSLINRHGDTRVRQIKQFTKEMGDMEKSVMYFISPADVKNTSFMNWSYDSDKNDDQWIYLPAIRKIKRISSDSKSDYFMGSDFTYDDLGDRKVDQDNHTILKEETIDGNNYYVIQSIPKDDEYMYSRTITWINKDNFVGLKKEFYDEDDELLKILSVEKTQTIDGIIIITKSVMENVQKDHKTIMELSNVELNTGLSDSKFTDRMMMRGL